MRITNWQPLREILSAHSARLFRHLDDWCETPARQKPATESRQDERTDDRKQQDHANPFQLFNNSVKRLADNDLICLRGRYCDALDNHSASVAFIIVRCRVETRLIRRYRLKSHRRRMNSVERGVL